MRLHFIAAAAVTLLARPLAAEEEPQPIQMVLHPRAIESPMLKYRLLPAEGELKPGDAAPILLRLPWERWQWMDQGFRTLDEWEKRPLDAPEWATSNGVLPETIFSEMKRAAFRRDAHWEFPIREVPFYHILLPDVQGLRGFLRYGLVARIRYHISRGEFDEARTGIVAGLADARHVSKTPFYVVQFNALAIHRAMFDVTGELISQAGSPNLYWALSTLSDSLIELDRAASLEGDAFAMTFPAANDLDSPRDAKEWRKMGDQLIDLLVQIDELPGNAALAPVVLDRWAQHAREELPELLGVSQEKVAAMSAEEAGIRWYLCRRRAVDQQAAAVVLLPPHETWPEFRFRKLRKEVRALNEKAGTTESGLFDPGAIYVSVWALKRKIQSLRIIEAVRDYLAAHDGKLPASLDEIKDVSIPRDPMTEQPFEWRVDGKTAVLKGPPLPADAILPDTKSNRYTNRLGFLEYHMRVESSAAATTRNLPAE